MASLLRREGKFFDFFNEHADLAIPAAAELKLLLEDIGDLESAAPEHRALRKAGRPHHAPDDRRCCTRRFITPLDRDEIHQLITGMDDILDLMEEVAQCAVSLRRARRHRRGQAAGRNLCRAASPRSKEAVAKSRIDEAMPTQS